MLRKSFLAGCVLTGAAFLFLALNSNAQQFVQGSSLKLAEYYTNSTQMKTLLTGANATPRGTNQILIKQAKSESFATNGTRELTIEAPECLSDRLKRTLTSSGPLKVSTADGRFLIEGVGFLFQQTNSVLFISNQVHTLVRPEMMARSEGAPEEESAPSVVPGVPSQIEVHSRWFEYAKESGLAVYHDGVTVAGTNLGMTSDQMTLLLPFKERQLKTVTADRNVVMDYEVEAGKIHATGDKGTYSTVSGLARVTGNPQWTAEQWQGHGDELIIDRTNKVFIANGNAFLKFPEAEAGSAGLFGTEPTNAVAASPGTGPATNKFIEITCDHYVRFTNSAVFNQDVRVAETTSFFETNGTMTCSVLTANFLSTNKLESLLADTNVVIQQIADGETNQFTAARGYFTASNSVMLLTGDPKWRAGLREGKGDVLRVNMHQQALEAIGNAWMRAPSSELGDAMPGGARPAATLTPPAGAGAVTNDFADLYSKEYSVSRTNSVFKGGVHVVDPLRMWDCQEITIASNPGPDQKKVSLVADRDVTFKFTDLKGQQLNGKCETAYYDYVATPQGTNDMVRLTGHPVLQTTNGIVRNDLILVDHARSRLILPGNYVIRGTVPASVATNKALTPKL